MAALEDAYNDGMDIAVLSLGAPALSGPLDRDSLSCGGSLRSSRPRRFKMRSQPA